MPLIYCLLKYRHVKVLNAESPLTSVDLQQDGSTVAVGSTRGKVYIYDLRQGANPLCVTVAHSSSVHCLRFQKNLVSSSEVCSFIHSGYFYSAYSSPGLDRIVIFHRIPDLILWGSIFFGSGSGYYHLTAFSGFGQHIRQAFSQSCYVIPGLAFIIVQSSGLGYLGRRLVSQVCVANTRQLCQLINHRAALA